MWYNQSLELSTKCSSLWAAKRSLQTSPECNPQSIACLGLETAQAKTAVSVQEILKQGEERQKMALASLSQFESIFSVVVKGRGMLTHPSVSDTGVASRQIWCSGLQLFILLSAGSGLVASKNSMLQMLLLALHEGMGSFCFCVGKTTVPEHKQKQSCRNPRLGGHRCLEHLDLLLVPVSWLIYCLF